MKTTGSVRIDIIDEYRHTDGTEMIEGGICAEPGKLIYVPKSAVTEIRTEVDWCKVEKNTPIAVWNRGCRKSDAAMVFFRGVSGTFKYGGVMSRGEMTIKNFYDHAMLLTDWLKEHGGQDEHR